MASGIVLDHVTLKDTLERVLEVVDYDGFREAQVEARRSGRYLGIGLSAFVEPTGSALGALGTEEAQLRILPGGKVEAHLSSGSHGQSIETTMAQVVAEHLGCALDDLRVIQGDTDSAPYGAGTAGSRTAVLLGSAAQQAAAGLRSKVLEIAAHALEASPEDLEMEGSVVSVRGTPTRTVRLSEIAEIAYVSHDRLPPGMPPGLDFNVRFKGAPLTFANATHACICEVDIDSGLVKVIRYVVSEDCGPMINPMVVEGQIAGGVVQGIGGVLFEHMIYDDDGNPLTTTFLDYLLPTAADVPVIEYHHLETPAPTNPGGFKGVGEGGAIGAPPAVINAIADALSPFGVRISSQPLGPQQVRALLAGVGEVRTECITQTTD
jgi:carbon-monoxide dehydrogenase large subunit